MPNIVLTDIVKRWKDFYATDHVSLDIPDKAFVTLLGPSGCGKTTILRMIAGLETPTSGQIRIGDQIVFDSEAGINIPANKRKVGFLFQNYALWPNMTVYQNISFGLKNVKEKMNTYDYSYKTRKDVIRILDNPKKVIDLVNDSRDKKGRIIDDRAIIKIIDEFIVSQYTAKEIFKLHLEEGGVEEKVNSTKNLANERIKEIETKWLEKDILVEEDGKLVHIPNYNQQKSTLSEEELQVYISNCYDLENKFNKILSELLEIKKALLLSSDSDSILEHINKIFEEDETLDIKDDIDSIAKEMINVSSLHNEEKEKVLKELALIKEDLSFLGDDYRSLVISYLRKYIISIVQNDEKNQEIILKDMNKEILDFNTQVSNQLSSFLDKVPLYLSNATFDSELNEAVEELSYLPENERNEIRKQLETLPSLAHKVNKKGGNEANKRLIEGLSALNVKDREVIKNHLVEVEQVCANQTIKEFLSKVSEELKDYSEEVRKGILEEFSSIFVNYLIVPSSKLKNVIKEINNISNYLVEQTNIVISNHKDQLERISKEYGEKVRQLQISISDINNLLKGISGKAEHLSSVRGLEKEEIELSLRRVARIVKVEEFMDRYPNELSGGQQQRVAIARTLAPGPKVLFMDEPLSNLDAKLRLEMRSELKRLHVDTGATFVYVTHDQLEAMTLATHICLLNNGVLQQYDAPLTIYNKPSNLFVADFVGNPAITLVEVKAKQNDDGTLKLNFFNNREAIYRPNSNINLEELRQEREEKEIKKAELLSILKKRRSYVEKGNKDVIFNYHISTVDGTIDRKDEKAPEIDDYVIGIRPEYFFIHEGNKGLNGEVYSAMPSGMETTIKINVDGYILTSVIFGSMNYQIGEKIEIGTKGNNILLFDKVSGELISSGTLEI